MDVHPILYPLMTKGALALVGLSPLVNPDGCILFLRLFSILPMAILVVLGYTHVQRWMGGICGLLFSLLLGCASSTYYYAEQIRMYSWAALFVFCTFLCGYRCAQTPENRKPWVGMALFALLAGYTHYYALAAVFFLEIFLLAALWKPHPEYRLRWLLFGLIQAVGYLPGLLLLYRQMTSVAEGYWISIQYPDILKELLAFFFLWFEHEKISRWCGILVLLLLGYTLVRAKIKREPLGQCLSRTLGFCLFPLFGVCGAGMLLSLIQPILIARYLFPMAGLYWLMVAALLSRLKSRAAPLLLTALFLAVGIAGGIDRYTSLTQPQNQDWRQTIQAQAQPGDVFFFSDLNVGCQPAVFFPEMTLYFQNEFYFGEKNGLAGFARLQTLETPLDLPDQLQEGQRVWILDSARSHLADLDYGDLTCSIPPMSFYHPCSGEWFNLSLWYKS